MNEEEELSAVEELLERWNAFARGVIDLKEKWESFQELYLESTLGEIESSVGLSKYASMFGKVKFSLMLPELIGHCIAYGGGFDHLILEEEKEE